jgi:hypothetical protein
VTNSNFAIKTASRHRAILDIERKETYYVRFCKSLPRIAIFFYIYEICENL